jgi:hypothetical protein
VGRRDKRWPAHGLLSQEHDNRRIVGRGWRKSYNDLLEEKNLIWAGVLRAGDATPLNERMESGE